MNTLRGKIKEIVHEMIRTKLRMRNLKRETESFLIIAQNNAIRTNCVKAKLIRKRIASVGYAVIEMKQLNT